jgi:hypothetical protein
VKRSTIFLAKTALLLGLSCWSGDVYGQTQRTVTGRSGVTWQSSSRLPRPQRSIYTSSAAALAGQEEVVGEPTLDPNADASIMSGSEEIVSGDAGMIYEGDEVIVDGSAAITVTLMWVPFMNLMGSILIVAIATHRVAFVSVCQPTAGSKRITFSGTRQV